MRLKHFIFGFIAAAILVGALKGAASLVPLGAVGQTVSRPMYLPQQSAALEAYHFFTGFNLRDWHVINHSTTAKWVLIFDVATGSCPPSNGAVTPLDCWSLPIQASGVDGYLALGDYNVNFANGICMVVSTNTSGCFALTTDAGATDFLWAKVD